MCDDPLSRVIMAPINPPVGKTNYVVNLVSNDTEGNILN